MTAVAHINETAAYRASDIVRALRQLPSAPKVLPRLQQLLNDGNSSIYDIVGLVRLDPGIAARVLQIANSVYFNKGARIISVEDAVVRVGYDQIYELVSHAVASEMFDRPLVVYGMDSDEVWQRAVSCALAAETLAGLVGEDRNAAYTSGLLHGIGMIAIDQWAMQNQPVLLFFHRGMPREFIESERALIGLTQAEVGAQLLEDWGFPYSVIGPVRWQYTPHSSVSHLRAAALLHAAKWVRSIVCGERSDAPAPDRFTLQPLRLQPQQLERISAEIRLRMVAVRHLLECQ